MRTFTIYFITLITLIACQRKDPVPSDDDPRDKIVGIYEGKDYLYVYENGHYSHDTFFVKYEVRKISDDSLQLINLTANYIWKAIRFNGYKYRLPPYADQLEFTPDSSKMTASTDLNGDHIVSTPILKQFITLQIFFLPYKPWSP